MPPVNSGRSTSPSTALLRVGEDRVGIPFHLISFQVLVARFEYDLIGIYYQAQNIPCIFKNRNHKLTKVNTSSSFDLWSSSINLFKWQKKVTVMTDQNQATIFCHARWQQWWAPTDEAILSCAWAGRNEGLPVWWVTVRLGKLVRSSQLCQQPLTGISLWSEHFIVISISYHFISISYHIISFLGIDLN